MNEAEEGFQMANICYACAQRNSDLMGNSGAGRVNERVWVDSETGRAFCAMDLIVLLSWELDDRPEPLEHHVLLEWLNECDFAWPHPEHPCGRDLV